MERDLLLRELNALTVALHKGDADSGALERCEELLQESDGAIDLYVELMHMHAALRLMANSDDETDHDRPLLSSNGADDAENPASDSYPWIATTPRTSNDVRGRLSRILLNRNRMIAAALVIAAIIPGWFQIHSETTIKPELEPQPVATLISADGAVWSDARRYEINASLMEGQVISLSSGRVLVSMSCGAELALKGPCSISFVGSDKVRLQNGLLSVRVAEWTDKFTVETAVVDVVDLGDQFVVFADSNAGTVEAHAIEGKLRVRASGLPEDQRPGTLVSAGEALRVDTVQQTTKRLKANNSLFDQEFDNARPFKRIQIYNTGYDAREGDEDPHWRIVASSEEFNAPFHAVVCNAIKDIYLPNDPQSSQWISIKHPVDDNCPPSVMYTFETEFDLTGYDISTVTVVANVLADNGVSNIRINGKPVEFKPWIDWAEPHNKFRKVDFKKYLVDGVNSIEFDVWNSYGVNNPYGPNPLAIRVEWQAFGRLSPHDESLAGSDTSAESRLTLLN